MTNINTAAGLGSDKALYWALEVEDEAKTPDDFRKTGNSRFKILDKKL